MLQNFPWYISRNWAVCQVTPFLPVRTGKELKTKRHVVWPYGTFHKQRSRFCSGLLSEGWAEPGVFTIKLKFAQFWRQSLKSKRCCSNHLSSICNQQSPHLCFFFQVTWNLQSLGLPYIWACLSCSLERAGLSVWKPLDAPSSHQN